MTTQLYSRNTNNRLLQSLVDSLANSVHISSHYLVGLVPASVIPRPHPTPTPDCFHVHSSDLKCRLQKILSEAIRPLSQRVTWTARRPVDQTLAVPIFPDEGMLQCHAITRQINGRNQNLTFAPRSMANSMLHISSEMTHDNLA